MTARAGVTVGGDVSVSPQVTCMNLSGSSSAPVARLTLTTEFALGAKRVHGRNANAPHENFLTDARWSPDGVCLLTAGAEDGTFRVYDVPGELPALRGGVGDAGGEKFDDEMNDANETFDDENNGDTNDRLPPDSLWPALRIKAGEAVRDYDWWPKMDAHADTATCLFASACKAQPVHVWDAISGKIKASYCGRNALDEPVDFNVVCFASGAEKIFAGRNNEIRTWDVTRPGYSGDLLWRGGKGGVSFGGSFGGSFGNKNGSSFGNKNAYSSVASTENTFFKGLVTALQSAPLTSTAASSSQGGRRRVRGWDNQSVPCANGRANGFLHRTRRRDYPAQVVAVRYVFVQRGAERYVLLRFPNHRRQLHTSQVPCFTEAGDCSDRLP